MSTRQALQYTEQVASLCDAKGKRLTDNRRLVLETLARHDSAMSAYEIIDALKTDMPTVKPPTVYRALEFLMELGIVHHVESKNRFLLCSHLNHTHRAQILVCDKCGAIEELVMKEEVLAALSQSAADHGFELTSHSFELHGLCAQCQEAA